MLRSLALGLALGALVLAACVGDEPINLGPPLNIPLSEGGAQASSGAASSGDGGGHEATACAPNLTLCGDTCVDVHADPNHCGHCGRTCGKTTCSAGVCPPYETASGFTNIYALAASPDGIVISADKAVSKCAQPNGCTQDMLVTFVADAGHEPHRAVATDKDVYFDVEAGDYYIVKSCPISGCSGAAPTEVEKTVSVSIGGMAAGPKHVAWIRTNSPNDQVQARLLPDGAPTNLRPTVGGGDWSSNPDRELTHPIELLSIGAKSFLWGTGGLASDPNKQLRFCTIGDACTTPHEIGTGSATLSALTYFDGHHYIATAVNGTASIYAIDDATPLDVKLTATDVEISDVAADATGLYWANPKTGQILRCTNLQDCTNPEKLASDQTGVKYLEVGPKFVYWSVAGKVMQVAK